MNSVLVLSIKPKYAEAIYSGEKQFEFRRAVPHPSTPKLGHDPRLH